MRLGHLLTLRSVCNRPDLPLLSVYREHGVILKAERSDNFNKPGEDLGKYQVVEVGDVVLNRMKAWRGSIGVSPVAGIVSPDYYVARPNRNADSRYLHYLLRSRPMIAEYGARSTGIRSNQWRLQWNDMQSIRVTLPPLSDQATIGNCLGLECERVSTLLTRLQQANDAADEAWAAHTRDLVGFDRYDPVQIRHVARPGTGHTPSRSHPEWWIPEECTLPWFTLADVHQLRKGDLDYVSETSEYISEIGLANSSAVRHPANTVLLSRTASVGFAAITATEMAVSQDFMTWTCGPRLEPTFLLHALRASRPELLGLMHGSTHKTIYMPDLLALRVPLPPVSVQRDVATKADRLSASRRGLTLKNAAMRTKLAEYRDALITEAVTGQLDVTAVSDAQMDERMHEAVESATA